MFGAGFLSKASGVGWSAKVAVASTAAVLTMTAAVAAAVVLPPGGDSDPAVLQSATLQGGALVDPTTSTTTAGADLQAGGGVSTPTTAGSTSGTTDAGARAAVATPTTPLPSLPIPSVPLAGGALPDLSTLTNIPTQVMSCLAPVFALVTSMPAMPSPAQLSQIGPSIVACVSGIVEDLPLPSGMNACISEIMGFVSSMTSQLPNGVPDVGDLDVAACIPSGLPVPTGMSGFTGGGFPFSR